MDPGNAAGRDGRSAWAADARAHDTLRTASRLLAKDFISWAALVASSSFFPFRRPAIVPVAKPRTAPYCTAVYVLRMRPVRV